MARPISLNTLLFATCISLLSACQSQRHGAESACVTNANPLISPKELAIEISSQPPRILDLRPPEYFAESHIPTALSVPADAWVTHSLSPQGLEDRKFWDAAIATLGITADRRTVLYGEDPLQTARIWWLLSYWGVENAAVLDGGWTAWNHGRYAQTKTTRMVQPCQTPLVLQAEIRMEMAELIDRLDDPALTVVDTRSREEHEGTVTLGSRPGCIPGSLHLDWMSLLDDSGRFRDVAAVQGWAVSHNLQADAEIVVYCYSGARSSLVALTLKRAGFRHIRNYYEGWQQWSANPAAPAEIKSAID